MNSTGKRSRPLSQQPVVRILIVGVFEVLGLISMATLLDGLVIDRVGTVILAVAFIGLLNTLLWPILSRILLPFAVFTGGLLFLMLNGAILWLASQFIDGFEVSGLWTATITALGVTAINVILSTLFTIDDGGSFIVVRLPKS